MSENNKPENIPPNLYSILFSTSDTNNNLNLDNLINPSNDEDFLENNLNPDDDNIFILDKKLREERYRRLNEKDKIYKIKKHYFLKDSYKKVVNDDMIKMEYERLKEEDFLKKCQIAENKLYEEDKLNSNDIYYILKRNYTIYTPNEQNDINILQRTYKIYDYISGFSSVVLISYVRAVMLFFKFEIRTKFISYAFLGLYGTGIFFSLKHYVNESYSKQLGKMCYKARDRILDYENEYLKVPFDEDEKKYKPEERTVSDLFKI